MAEKLSGMGHQEFYEEDAEERRREAEQRASAAEAKAAARTFARLRLTVTHVSPRYVTFARLRLTVTHVSPRYVTCSLFQSDNAGTNWACVGTDLTFPDDWFRGVFGAADTGRRIEFAISGAHEVSD